jgi:hypothetical protein
MSPAARSIQIFGLYLLALSLTLLLAPNLLLQTFGLPLTHDVWIRVVGMLVAFLGVYYLRAAATGLTAFFAWTVPVRASVLLFFGAFVALGFASPMLMLFAVVDALGAGWTWWALRRDAAAT